MDQDVFKIKVNGQELWRCCDLSVNQFSLDRYNFEPPLPSLELAVERLVESQHLSAQESRSMRHRLLTDYTDYFGRNTEGYFIVDLDGFFAAVERITSIKGEDRPRLSELEKNGLRNIALAIHLEANGNDSWRDIAAAIRATAVEQEVWARLFSPSADGIKVLEPTLRPEEVTALDGGLRYFEYLAESVGVGMRGINLTRSVKDALAMAIKAFPSNPVGRGLSAMIQFRSKRDSDSLNPLKDNYCSTSLAERFWNVGKKSGGSAFCGPEEMPG